MNSKQTSFSKAASLAASTMAMATGCLASGLVMAESDEQALLALVALLEQETELATRTRMNADYVPGMVTVLYGQDVRQSGKRTVAEALTDVAGIFLTPTNSGELRTNVRGIGSTLNASNMKFLLDNVAVNRAVDGAADWIMRMPLSQVDRIEVIRGPGSAFHGGFAFSGVVNVITRQDSAAGVMAGSRGMRQSDVLGQYQWQSGLALNLNYTNWSLVNSGQSTGLDTFPEQYTNSPGKVYDHERGELIRARLQWQKHTLSVQHIETERGAGFGKSGALPFEMDPRDETFTGINLKSEWALSRSLDLVGSLVWQQTEVLDADFVPIPAGVRRPGGREPTRETRFIRLGNEDSRARAALGTHWQPAQDHKVFAEAAFEVLKVESVSNTRSVLGQPSVKGPNQSALVLPGSRREIVSLTLQDQWSITPALDLTLGVRRDNYSDHVAHTSPRVALLWRSADHHIFKAQYAEAFRPPTLAEANPGEQSPAGKSPDLREEVINSAELSYIYRTSDKRLRTTLFNTLVSDQIEYFLRPGDSPVWRNRSDIESRGVEWEWQQRFAHGWQWEFNLTWLKARDFLDDDKELFGSSSLVGNSPLIWQQSGTVRHTLSVHGVEEREGYEPPSANTSNSSGSGSGNTVQQPRSDSYPAYVLLDYALNWRDVASVQGMDLTLACINLTDAEYRSPATPNHFPDGLRQGRRTYQAGITFSF